MRQLFLLIIKLKIEHGLANLENRGVEFVVLWVLLAFGILQLEYLLWF